MLNLVQPVYNTHRIIPIDSISLCKPCCRPCAVLRIYGRCDPVTRAICWGRSMYLIVDRVDICLSRCGFLSNVQNSVTKTSKSGHSFWGRVVFHHSLIDLAKLLLCQRAYILDMYTCLLKSRGKKIKSFSHLISSRLYLNKVLAIYSHGREP